MPEAVVLPGRPDAPPPAAPTPAASAAPAAPIAPSILRTANLLTGRTLLVVVCVLVGIRALALLSALPTESSERVSAYFTDGERYHHVAGADGVPYRDFEVEYPPVTVGFIELVAGSDVHDTLRRLAIATFVLDLLTLAAVAYGFRRHAAVAYLVLSTPFFFLPFVYFRVDMLVVALTVCGLALAKRRRERAGGGLLALAVFAKLWPLAVIPVVLVERRRRAVVAVVAGGVLGTVGWWLLGGAAGFEQVLTFRGAHGFQIESVAGGVVRLFTGATPRSESGALRVGDAPFAVTLLLGVLMLAGVAWVWSTVARRAMTGDRLLYGVAPLTAVAIFMVCSPLLSPQFLVWLVPFGAIAWAARERVLGSLVGLAVVATMLVTQVYGPLNDDLALGHAVLALRNGLLVAIVAVGMWRLATATAHTEVDVDGHD